MRALRLFSFVVIGLGIVPACSLTTSLSGLAGPAEEVADASSEASLVDASPDAPLAEGAAPDAADGAGPVFQCAGQTAVFCADFESEPFDDRFTEVLATAGGTYAAGPGKFGRGLVAKAPSHTTGSISAARVKWLTELVPATSFTYSYDALTSVPGGMSAVNIGGFYYNGPYYTLSLRVRATGCFLQEYADAYSTYPTLSRDRPLAHCPTPGKWTHVVLKATFVPGGSTLTMMFDDEVMLDGVAIDAYRYASQPKIVVGMKGVDGAGDAVTMSFDDVLVTSP